MADLAEIREEGVTLQVVSEWSAWSPCKQCVYNRGIKTSRGHCRLKRSINSASGIFILPAYYGSRLYVRSSSSSLFILSLHYAGIITLDNGGEERLDRYTFLQKISGTSLQVNIRGVLPFDNNSLNNNNADNNA